MAPPDTSAGGGGFDVDMLLIRASIDARSAGTPPPDAFWDAVHRHDAVLRRTAHYLRLPVHPELLEPRTLRICASWLLSN